MNSGKIALVTGASKGIGKAIAQRLAKDGFDIWLNYHSDDSAAEEVAYTIKEQGRNCKLLPFDVSDSEQCKVTLLPLLEKACPFAIINNAGFAKDSIFAMMPQKNWQDVLNVHLQGFYNVTNTCIPFMLRKRQGRILTITSTSGQTGVGGQVNYSCAKAGLIGATRSLAVEIAKRNILVNAVAPGFIGTDMLEDLPMEKIIEQIPLRRIGTPNDVANIISFLVSVEASYITGQVFNVNGGVFTG